MYMIQHTFLHLPRRFYVFATALLHMRGGLHVGGWC